MDDQPVTPQASSRFNLGQREIAIGIGIAALVALIAVPMVLRSQKDARRDEVLSNVNAIRDAEIEYQSAFSEYVSAEAAPRAPHEVDAEAVPWAPTSGFTKLSWAPDSEQVRGAYWVIATADGFTVHGACDVDGDGERATFEATLEREAVMTSEAGVY